MNANVFTAGSQSGEVATDSSITPVSLKRNELIPNNEKLPLLFYFRAFRFEGGDPASLIERTFAANHWTGSWRNGIYPFHHYHSTAHEVLGVYQGAASLQFGGEGGMIQQLTPGDVVVVPAGVSHKNLSATADFGVVGAYPAGQHWDMCYGRIEEHPEAEENIHHVAMPEMDPVHGERGPLFDHWRND
jgi:uncharacterized protein YjlB